MTEPLKLVPSKDEDDDDCLVEGVKRIEELVDELITVNEKLNEDLEAIRLALGIDRMEFARLRDDDFHGLLHATSGVVKSVEDVVAKLEKVLGYV